MRSHARRHHDGINYASTHPIGPDGLALEERGPVHPHHPDLRRAVREHGEPPRRGGGEDVSVGGRQGQPARLLPRGRGARRVDAPAGLRLLLRRQRAQPLSGHRRISGCAQEGARCRGAVRHRAGAERVVAAGAGRRISRQDRRERPLDALPRGAARPADRRVLRDAVAADPVVQQQGAAPRHSDRRARVCVPRGAHPRHALLRRGSAGHRRTARADGGGDAGLGHQQHRALQRGARAHLGDGRAGDGCGRGAEPVVSGHGQGGGGCRGPRAAAAGSRAGRPAISGHRDGLLQPQRGAVPRQPRAAVPRPRHPADRHLRGRDAYPAGLVVPRPHRRGPVRRPLRFRGL
ncbi:MAG: hypothetical protein BWY52_00672 [Chloroflexi bacterium ADurb.Bin325]|nr:MAG: hypothetical protein BWY52_00672 [Chloroflexi bacterium ADurb.Bin325]